MGHPTVSFCISTYKRPALLKAQLELIATQSFSNFEVIISDNDPEKSSASVVQGMQDPRFKYFSNEVNLGMVKSFNKSIERSVGEYIVMVTDDDPVKPNMLQELLHVVALYPSYPVYCGCLRTNKKEGLIETYNSEDFVFQLLHPQLTPWFLWSSCLLKREAVVKIGGLPDFGSPHLADHAMLALCSKYGGGVFINTTYGALFSHDQNFSKSNFELYYIGGKEFHKLITENFPVTAYKKNGTDALFQHLKRWILTNAFNLRKYFTFQNRNFEAVKDVVEFTRKIMELPFMHEAYPRYVFKLIMFYVKYPYNSYVRKFKNEKKYI